jgi:uncharacterized protein YggE
MKQIFGLLLILFVTTTTHAQTTQELEVRGYGRLKSQPDLGVISASVTTIQKDFGATISVLTSDTEKLITHLEKIGFKRSEIKTADLKVSQNTVYRQGNSYDSGFVGSQSLRIEFENTKENIAKLIDSFTKSPIEAQFSFNFTVSDNLRDKIQNDLIKKAIADAKQKAKLIAEASNQQIVKIKKIKYGTFSVDDFGGYYGTGLNIEIPSTHQVSPRSLGFDIEEMTFNDYVIIIYEIK